jgi:hypothetical protein
MRRYPRFPHMIVVEGALTAEQLDAIQAAVSEATVCPPVTRTVTDADAARLLWAFVWLLRYVEKSRPAFPPTSTMLTLGCADWQGSSLAKRMGRLSSVRSTLGSVPSLLASVPMDTARRLPSHANRPSGSRAKFSVCSNALSSGEADGRAVLALCPRQDAFGFLFHIVE